MQVSSNGITLIKKYEGCRLSAYKPIPSEKNWTIGWGHCGSDVKAGSTITQSKADSMLVADLQKYVGYVNALSMTLNQNQFDALVSFCYNCGQGNLKTLCSDKSIASISKWITAYNLGGGVVLQGLVRRRAEEKALFDKSVGEIKQASTTRYEVTADMLNIRKSANATSKILGTLKKNDTVQVVSISKGWAKLKSNDAHVYVNATYIKKA